MIPAALLSRLAIIGVSTLITVIVPYMVQNRPVATFVFDRLGPRIVDRATDVIVDKVGPPIPEVRPDCPPCPQVTPALPDVDIKIPKPEPSKPLPVRIVDETLDVVDNSVDAASTAVTTTVTWVDQLARLILKLVLE